jgi:endo-1,4-beta-xylanase
MSSTNPSISRRGREDGLRASPFLEAFGPDYIGIAYRAAAEADPAAVLVLNEMGLEYGSEAAERKRRALLGLLNRELARGTPIQAVGISRTSTPLVSRGRTRGCAPFCARSGAWGLA